MLLLILQEKHSRHTVAWGLLRKTWIKTLALPIRCVTSGRFQKPSSANEGNVSRELFCGADETVYDKCPILRMTQSWLKNVFFLLYAHPLKYPSPRQSELPVLFVVPPVHLFLSVFSPGTQSPDAVLGEGLLIRSWLRCNCCTDPEHPGKESRQPASGVLVLLCLAAPILQGLQT